MSWRLSLVRHGEIHPRWRDHCYGAADVGLSPRGRAQSRRLAERLAGERPDEIWSSDLRRALYLAETLAARCGLTVKTTEALRERNYGDWEKRPWNEIYRQVGNAMEGMIREPDRWHPPGGETTYGMRDRVLAWLTALEADDRHPGARHIVAVGHSGPIAALLGTLAKKPVTGWSKLVPGLATRVVLGRKSPGHPFEIPDPGRNSRC